MVKFRPNIYIGGYRDVPSGFEGDRTAQEHGPANVLLREGITAVLNVAYEIDDDPLPPQVIRYVKVGIADNNLNQDYMKKLAVKTMKDMLDKDEVVLVHCAAGLSRSVYTAVMAVAEREDKDWHDIFDELKKIHPFAMVGPLFHGENKLYHFYQDQEEAAK